jgi:hypothetical protein
MLRNLRIAGWGSFLFISVLLLANCGGGGGGSGGSAQGSSSSKSTTLASGLTNALPLTVDSSNVFWTEYDNAPGTVTVKKISTAGGAATALASSQGLSQPYTWDIAVDSDSVYWIERSGSSCSLKKVGKNGGTGTPQTSDPVKPMGLAVDSSNIYYTDFNGGTINKIGTATPLASSQTKPHYIAVNSTDVYWVNDDSDGSIMKVDINGATQPQKIGVTTLATKRDWASHIIAVDSSNLYFIDSPDGQTNGTINKLDPNSKAVTTLWSSATLVPDSIAIDSANVYWSAGNSIYKVSKNGGTASQVQTSLLPCFIALDSANIYFTDVHNVIKVAKW